MYKYYPIQIYMKLNLSFVIMFKEFMLIKYM
jgi:hypothetical protein